MFPLGDDNPTRTRPILTLTLIGVCVLVFLYQFTLTDRQGMLFVYSWGFIPGDVFGRDDVAIADDDLPGWIKIFTSMFLHGDFMHIVGNMLFLWIFGNNIEDSFGRFRFFVFYLLCGLAAAMAQAGSDAYSTVPMIGASGAVSGVLGAYILMFPQARVRVLIWFGIITLMRLRAYVVLGLWFAFQLVSAALVPVSQEGGVAFWAHIGGFVAGMALMPLFRPRRSLHVSGRWG